MMPQAAGRWRFERARAPMRTTGGYRTTTIRCATRSCGNDKSSFFHGEQTGHKAARAAALYRAAAQRPQRDCRTAAPTANGK